MKKIVTSGIVTGLLFLMLFSSACSQEIAMNGVQKNVSASSTEKDPVYANDINSKVLRSFYKTYGEVSAAKWFKVENGYAVSFKNNEISSTVFYRNNGTVEYKVSRYGEDRMPPATRHLVKSNFYDYSILQVSEVHKDGSVGFFVKIEDSKSIKTVRVMGEEWQVVEDLVKK
ncbi:MAG TPA: hypothetical protein VF476_03455 [Chitinophagaceae bacterium]